MISESYALPQRNKNHGPRLKTIRSLTPAALKARLDSSEPLELLDVRNDRERSFAIIEPSRQLVLEEEQRLVTLPRDTPLVFYCHNGLRSQRAAQRFLLRGFSNVYNLEGGIEAWANTVDPSVPHYE